MPKPSQYSLIRSTCQLPFYTSSAPPHSKLYPFVIQQSNFSSISSQEHSVSFSQHFSYPIPVLCKTQLLDLILFILTSSNLFQIIYCSAQFSTLPTLYTPRSFCVPHLLHNLHPLPHATPGTENNTLKSDFPPNPYTLSICHMQC